MLMIGVTAYELPTRGAPCSPCSRKPESAMKASKIWNRIGNVTNHLEFFLFHGYWARTDVLQLPIAYRYFEFAKQKRSVNQLMQQWFKTELPQLLKHDYAWNKCGAEA